MKKFEDKQLIMLLAGKATRLYPLTLGLPKCLLSVRQKPMIYNMIIPFINEGLKDIILVVNKENESLIKQFFCESFSNIKLNIKYIVQKKSNGPAAALKLTRKFIIKPTILLLGDTLCSLPKKYDYSWIGVKKVKDEEKSKYCLIKSNENNQVIDIIDKPKHEVNTNNAAIGLYFFSNFELLKQVLDIKISKRKGEYQLSSYFDLYRKKEKIRIKEINDWQDIGTLEGYMETISNNFSCRNFNSIYLDEFGLLHKKGSNDIVSSEIKWYRNVQKTDFEKLILKFYDNKNDDFEYCIEYSDLLTLSEYMTYYPLTDYSRKTMFNIVLNKLMVLYKNNSINTIQYKSLFKNMLIDKTYKRLEGFTRQDLIKKDRVIINNIEYSGLLICLEKLLPSIEKICSETEKYTTIIHGDPSFSNILFSPRTLKFKLIDARGNFGIDTIYGDYRYDLAKLRHCYHGRYDEIAGNLFEIKEDNGNFKFNFYKNIDCLLYDNLMEEYNISIIDIELIEALLFVSMIPLHKDNLDRQLAFFCQGIKILNNQLKVRNL